MGEGEAAQTLLKRLVARGNDLGLFAEKIDAARGSSAGISRKASLIWR